MDVGAGHPTLPTYIRPHSIFSPYVQIAAYIVRNNSNAQMQLLFKFKKVQILHSNIVVPLSRSHMLNQILFQLFDAEFVDAFLQTSGRAICKHPRCGRALLVARECNPSHDVLL